MKATRLTLPVPPAANRYWRVWRGRAVTSPEARGYRATVVALCRRQKIAPHRTPVAVDLVWYRAKRMGDLDGRGKVLLDALQWGGVYVNDSQIRRLSMEMFDTDRSNPRMEVTVSVYQEAA